MREKYLTVQALTKYIKRKIDTDSHLQGLWLKGEISNFKHHSRGHMYLTIKDQHARIQAVMFAASNRRLKFTPENGMKVLIRGDISVFEPYGQYQLYINQMEPDGLGSLYLAFEQLKEKLAKQGYFEKQKKSIPPFPNHIGIITSPTGAAIRDILTTIKRRYPIVQTTIISVQVQGTDAAKKIEQAIQLANHINDFDLLIVGRGGGSIEDLWSFNEEIVAKAIYYSKIPIISAIGHETDITISDFVSDLRASTPTGAAEMAVPSQNDLKERINNHKHTLNRLLKARASAEVKLVKRLQDSYAFRSPEKLVQQKEQQLDKLTDKLALLATNQVNFYKRHGTNLSKRLTLRHPAKHFTEAVKRLNQITKLNHTYMKQNLQVKVSQNQRVMDKLIILNPLEVMKRGFAITYNERNSIITSIKQTKLNEKLTVKVSDGELDCEIIKIKGDKNDR